MKEQFVTYEIALALKELGFDEGCLAYFWDKGRNMSAITTCMPTNSGLEDGKNDQNILQADCTAPLWQQAIGWILKRLEVQNFIVSFEVFSDKSCTFTICGNELNYDYIDQAVLEAIEIIKKGKM